MRPPPTPGSEDPEQNVSPVERDPIMHTPELSQPESVNEPTQLFHAHLEVMVHLLRDDLRWSGPAAAAGGNGNGGAGRGGAQSRMVQLLHRERRHLLKQQDGNLAREARFRVMGDRLVSRLENDLGVDPRDAAVVVWFYRQEVARRREGAERGTDASFGDLMHQVGAAHARLLDGTDPFLPVPNRRRPAGFPLAVAVAATRLARSTRQETTWMDVEPLALEILQVVMGGGLKQAAS